ncbi:hypothetical protein C8Q77DRAFT_1159103 [Trametes polyzona]|nr:hypothetical protein C8Q77DRAFT_1159103 [Trametes polyzona]
MAECEESPFEPPGWLKTHPEMQQRGVDLCQCVKPTFVFQTSPFIEPVYAVKILSFDDEDQEAAIYRRLQHEQDPRNPVLPCEVLDLEPKPVLLMPFLSHIDEVELSYGPLSGLLSVFLQVVDGVQYLHERRIAHMDVCYGNILVALKEDEPQYNGVVAGKVYLIDFHTSRQLSSGPGVQHALPLPCTQVPPPPHLKRFDPYSWDVYCLGKFLERMMSLDRTRMHKERDLRGSYDGPSTGSSERSAVVQEPAIVDLPPAKHIGDFAFCGGRFGHANRAVF